MDIEVVKPKPDISLAKKIGHFNLLTTYEAGVGWETKATRVPYQLCNRSLRLVTVTGAGGEFARVFFATAWTRVC